MTVSGEKMHTASGSTGRPLRGFQALPLLFVVVYNLIIMCSVRR